MSGEAAAGYETRSMQSLVFQKGHYDKTLLTAIVRASVATVVDNRRVLARTGAVSDPGSKKSPATAPGMAVPLKTKPVRWIRFTSDAMLDACTRCGIQR